MEAVPAAAPAVFGASWPRMRAYADMLDAEGELRGLIGPRELPRLWTRHLLNSSAVETFVPDNSTFADVGSGAGFPGIVVALMRPDLDVHLIEPMERRTAWLSDVVEALTIPNVTIHRARADELHDRASFDVVSARAVAALKKLVPWVGPLVRLGGSMLALKGERAAAEVEEARKVLRKHGLDVVRIQEVLVPGTDEPTRVVKALRSHR